MIRVQLSDDQRRELRLLARQEVGRVSERIHFVLLSDQGHSPPEIAQLFHSCEAVVRYWLKRDQDQGLPGLYDEPRSGRPRKVSPAVEETLVKLIQDDPQQAGYLATFWTVAMVGLALVKQVGVTLSPSSVRGALPHLDLRWGRPRLAMPIKVDPDQASQQWAIAKAVVEAGPAAAIV